MDVRKFADGKLPHERRAMPSRNRFEKKLCGTGSNIRNYPALFLPVVLNTNCNVYNADKTLGMQCMSGNLFIQNGKMHHGFSTETLSNKEKQHAVERS